MTDPETAPSDATTPPLTPEALQEAGLPEVSSLPEVRDATRESARNLRTVLWKYIRRHLPERVEPPSEFPEPPRQSTGHASALLLLQLVPWLLTVLFGLSFFWDFNGMAATIAGVEFRFDGLLRILAVSGLIGFLTNWLAITMLFHPRRRRPLLGQGLIPAQRERVIYRLASTVSEELINADIIKKKIEESGIIGRYRDIAFDVTRGVIEDPEFRKELKGLTGTYIEQMVGSEEVRQKIVAFIIQKIEEYAGQGLGGIALKTYRFLGEQDFKRRIEEAVTQLPTSIDSALDQLDGLLDSIPEKIQARSEDIEEAVTKLVLTFVENLDVYSIVATNMQAYDERRLEDLMKRATNEQLNYIKYLGGVLGSIGGLVIWEPVAAMTVLGVLGALVVGLDQLLMRRA
ncbi:MAG: DUF445 family protein [Rhodothermales bacterium]